jgi:hypothetical protein
MNHCCYFCAKPLSNFCIKDDASPDGVSIRVMLIAGLIVADHYIETGECVICGMTLRHKDKCIFLDMDQEMVQRIFKQVRLSIEKSRKLA